MEEISISAEQRKLVLYHRLFPQDTAFTMAHVERVEGEVDLPRLRDALQWVLGESTGLNTIFQQSGDDGADVAYRHPGTPEVRIVDAPEAADLEAESAAVAAATGRSADGFRSPEQWPLYEAVLYRGRFASYLSLICSHMVGDAVSMYNIGEMTQILYVTGELPEDYASSLADAPVNTLSPQRVAASAKAYRELLHGFSQISHDALNGDREPSGVLRGETILKDLPDDLDQALRNSELVQASSPYIVFTAAYAVVLSALSGESDVAVGVPMATRRNWRQMYALGYFVNTLPLGLKLDSHETFADLCATAGGNVSKMLRHKLFDLTTHAAEVLEGPRNGPVQVDNTITLYRKAFPLDLPDCESTALHIPRASIRYPLTLTVREKDPGFAFHMEYLHRFAAADPFAMMVHVLRTVVENPFVKLSDIGVLAPDRARTLDQLVNGPRPVPAVESAPQRADVESGTLDGWFAATAARHPGRTAVSDAAGEWTYAELDAAAERVARRLDARGHGSHVAVAVGRRRELLAVLLGVLRSGRAYVPLGAEAPADRVRHILGQFEGISVITDDDTTLDLPDVGRVDSRELLAEGTEPAPVDGTVPTTRTHGSDDAAYVIFTSGSTGTPKGVEVTHHNATRLFRTTAADFDFDERDVWCLFHSYAFDFAVWESFGALLHGGRLVVPDEETIRSPQGFATFLAEQRVTVLNQTPSAFRRLSDALDAEIADQLAVRWVVFGGEKLAFDVLRPWQELLGTRARLVNMYGITEITVHATFHEITPEEVWEEDTSVIGRPLGDLQLTVVDRNLHQCPPGVPGELLVAGGGLARGYVNEPALTRERFRTDTPYGARVYRTGDRCLVREDGLVVYLDRLDRQVQLRGHRVEPGEVEAALRALPEVKDAHVAVHTPTGGEPLLAAWLVPEDAEAGVPGDSLLREELARRLPPQMQPALYLSLSELPLTVNGKVDVATLPLPTAARSGGSGADDGLSGTVRVVVKVWTEAIGHEAIGPDDSFFEVGGTSMHVMGVHRRLVEELGATSLDVVELFECPTPRLLAARIDHGAGADRPKRTASRRTSAGAGRRIAARRQTRSASRNPAQEGDA